MKRVGLTVAGVMAVLAVAVGILFVPNLRVTIEAQPYFTNPITNEIYGYNTVEQSFVAKLDGLDFIEVLVGTHNRQNSSTVIFELYYAATMGDPLRRTEIAAGDLVDNNPFQFEFLPIVSSAGRSFRARWRSEDGTEGNAITLWGHREDLLPQGTAYVGGRRWTGDLVFSLGYQRSPAGLIGDVVAQMSFDRPGIWGEPAFYLVAGGLYIGVTLLYLFLVVRARSRGQTKLET